MPGCLRTNRSRILPTKPPFSCARVQDARSRHGASQTRGLRRACAARWARGGIGAGSHGSGVHTHRCTVRSPDSGLVQVCAASERSRPLRARRPLEHGGRQRRTCTACQVRSWRSARWARGRVGGRPAGRGAEPSAAGVPGSGTRPSAAGNTGCGANCTARGLMNPFTPTFPRYGAVIEIICYVTNK